MKRAAVKGDLRKSKKTRSGTTSVVPASSSSSPSREMRRMRVVTWNVNGIRAFSKKNLEKGDLISPFLSAEGLPDIICLQETKIDDSLVPKFENLFGDTYPFNAFACCTVKKGYAGTAVFCRQEPISVKVGFDGDRTSVEEGRCITVELEACYVVNTYVPNSGLKLDRLKYRTSVWDPALQAYLLALSEKKPVIWTGDLNVAHSDEDVAFPEKKRNKVPGFTDSERENFGLLVGGNGHIPDNLKKHSSLVGRPGPDPEELAFPPFIDAFYFLQQSSAKADGKDAVSGDTEAEGVQAKEDRNQGWSFWSYRFQAKAKNNGWRLDYFVVSQPLCQGIASVNVREDLYGLSDHCPVLLEISC